MSVINENVHTSLAKVRDAIISVWLVCSFDEPAAWHGSARANAFAVLLFIKPFLLQQLNLLKAKQKALVEQIEKEKIQSNKGSSYKLLVEQAKLKQATSKVSAMHMQYDAPLHVLIFDISGGHKLHSLYTEMC